eukprot:COSAG01_NODE_7413_length_3217_cov_10.390314_2_plen_61_part_00
MLCTSTIFAALKSVLVCRVTGQYLLRVISRANELPSHMGFSVNSAFGRRTYDAEAVRDCH